MAEITAAMVKDLREKSGAGMMDCKKALTETGGDMDAAIDWLRTKGLAAAAKKSSRTAAEGLVGVEVQGTRGAYRYSEMVDAWVAEKRYFKNGVTPDFSTTGNYEDVAHYTQIIWRGSTAVGCALASSASDDYLVCRYSPPGNVVGQKTL